jgi:hypothetical protein
LLWEVGVFFDAFQKTKASGRRRGVSSVADANYITIFTPDEVKVFDAEVSKLHITGEAVMKGWRCPKTKL